MSLLRIIGKKHVYDDPFWFRTAILETLEVESLDLPLQDLDPETLNIKLAN
jgi:hypothetical protein